MHTALHNALIATYVGLFIFYMLMWFERINFLSVLYCVGKAIEHCVPYFRRYHMPYLRYRYRIGLNWDALEELSDMF